MIRRRLEKLLRIVVAPHITIRGRLSILYFVIPHYIPWGAFSAVWKVYSWLERLSRNIIHIVSYTFLW